MSSMFTLLNKLSSVQGAAGRPADSAQRALRRRNQSEASKEKERVRNRRAQVLHCPLCAVTRCCSAAGVHLAHLTTHAAKRGFRSQALQPSRA